ELLDGDGVFAAEPQGAAESAGDARRPFRQFRGVVGAGRVRSLMVRDRVEGVMADEAGGGWKLLDPPAPLLEVRRCGAAPQRRTSRSGAGGSSSFHPPPASSAITPSTRSRTIRLRTRPAPTTPRNWRKGLRASPADSAAPCGSAAKTPSPSRS